MNLFNRQGSKNLKSPRVPEKQPEICLFLWIFVAPFILVVESDCPGQGQAEGQEARPSLQGGGGGVRRCLGQCEQAVGKRHGERQA